MLGDRAPLHLATVEAIEARLDAALQQLENFIAGKRFPASDGNREEVTSSDVLSVIPHPQRKRLPAL